MDLRIKIYTIAGRLIKEIERTNVTEKFVTVDWDGRDEDGDPLANGTYLYKIIVKTLDNSLNKSVLGKLAVIR
jgi:flagellar hook assembly protein FlgD